MRNLKFFITAIVFSIIPSLVFAAETVSSFIKKFTDIGLQLIPLLGMIAFLVFVYGTARFIKSTGSDKDIKDSKNLLIWGVIGMFIMVTLWGIISFIRSELGFTGTTAIPQIKF